MAVRSVAPPQADARAGEGPQIDADGNAPFDANIVGSGAFVVADTPQPVPLPAMSWLVALGLCVIAAARARRATVV